MNGGARAWRVDLLGRAVAVVHRSGLGYWLTPSPDSGLSLSTSLHASAEELRSELASRFGAQPDQFAFHAQNDAG